MKPYEAQVSGALTQKKVTELLSSLGAERSTAHCELISDLGRGSVWLRDGLILDAEIGGVVGHAALSRLLTLVEGTYRVTYGPVDRALVINEPVQELLLRRERRVSEWRHLLTLVPPLDSVVRVNQAVLQKYLPELPPAELYLLTLPDGRRTIVDLIDDSGLDAVAVLERIETYFRIGVLCTVHSESPGLYRHAGDDLPSDDLSVTRQHASAAPGVPPSHVLELPRAPRVPAEFASEYPRSERGRTRSSKTPVPIPGSETHSVTDPGLDQEITPASTSEAASSHVTVGRYEVLARIARGGMGTVYLCRVTGEGGFRRLFALKVLQSTLSDDREMVQMFLQEARLAARIHHPNVVGIVDVGNSAGQVYLVMDYVEGGSFFELIRRNPTERKPRLIVPAVLDLLNGLYAVHTLCDDDGTPLKLVHCDVTPHNMLMGRDGVCRISDFGVAKTKDILAGKPALRGKPGYLAPEQVLGEAVDHRADLFAAGLVLFNALTGEQLFRAPTVEQTLQNVLTQRVPRPSSVGLKPPEVFDSICFKALERDPERRYQSAEQMLNDLRTVAIKHDFLAPPTELATWVASTFQQDVQLRRLTVLDSSRHAKGRAGDSLLPPASAPLSQRWRSRADSASETEAEPALSDEGSRTVVLEAPDPPAQTSKRRLKPAHVALALAAGAAVGLLRWLTLEP